MGKNNNIIEINGKRYDARTGAALGHHASIRPKPHSGDVFGASQPQPAKSIPVQHEHHQPAHQTVKQHGDIIRRSAKSAKSHTPERSKTLMRSTVKKPAAGLKRRVKAHGHTDSSLAKPSLELSPKPSASSLDAKRLQHAKHVEKSKLVKRFGLNRSDSAIPIKVTSRGTASSAAPRHLPPRPKTAAPKHPPKHQNTTAELLDNALRHATSHQQTPLKIAVKKRRGLSKRITSISALVLALVLLIGFAASQSLTDVRLKVASAKAGFSASLPSDQPAGYHLSHLNYSPGLVALHFQSNSDNRKFAITEKASAWDSSTLRDTYVASSGQNYQTVESAGRTLYLLGQNTATWVSNGVWYQVQANDSLSSRQLVKLAASM